MTPLLRFDDLQAIIHQCMAHLPDHRKPSPNTRYTIQNTVLGAFGIFFAQSPSFLEYQRRLQHTKGHNNAQTLFGVAQVPCDNQVRTLLDPLAPSHLDPVFVEIFKGLEQHRMLAPFRVLGDQLLVALDDTTYFSSQTIHCPNCLTRHLANGHRLYYHPVITPVIVCPGRPEVIALLPEYIMPQDGQAKQDCEQEAGKRWLSKYAKVVAPHQVTLLGDDLYYSITANLMDDMGIGYSLVNLSIRRTTSMPKKKYLVTLSDEERAPLEHLLHGGTHATRQVTRARMLLKAAEGWEDSAIAAALSVGRATVERTRQRFVAEGLQALAERPCPGTQPKLDVKAPARLSAEAWSAAPEGRQRWTLPLLANRVVALGLAASYSYESVRRV